MTSLALGTRTQVAHIVRCVGAASRSSYRSCGAGTGAKTSDGAGWAGVVRPCEIVSPAMGIRSDLV